MNKCEWKDGKFKGCCNIMQARGNDVIMKDLVSFNDQFISGFNFCPFCGASLKKPVEIKPGMFGRFWDDNMLKDFIYGELKEIRESHQNRYKAQWGASFAHFTPGLPEGFNQDGTPKEVDISENRH